MTAPGPFATDFPMPFRHLVTYLPLAVLFLLFGCTPSSPGIQTRVDLAEVSQQISQLPQPQARPVSEGPVPDTMDTEADTTDLSVTTTIGNPLLPTGSPAPPAVKTSKTDGSGVLLNFDNADIYEVIQVIGETLGGNYIVDPQVKGTVNIRSMHKIPMDRLPVLFKKILAINGLDVRSEGDYNYVFPSEKPSTRLIYGRTQAGSLSESSRLIMQIVPVMHISAGEARNLIVPYLSTKGTVEVLESQNTLIIADFESSVLDVLTILSHLDVSPLSSLRVRLVKVKKAPLFDLRDELVEIIDAMRLNPQGSKAISVLPLERINCLLLVGSNDGVLDTTVGWIRQLDVVPTQGRDSIFIYNVRNSKASDLAGLVNNLLGNDSPTAATASPVAGPDEMQRSVSDPLPPTPEPPPAPRSPRRAGSGQLSSSLEFAGEPQLIADDSRNIILVRAHPTDYDRLLKILERLDNLPRQVLIEVLVAEVKLNDNWELGIEWAIKNNKININHADYNVVAGTNFAALDDIASGLTFSLTDKNNDIVGLLKALAGESDISILSSPQVLVLNNETATVNVGEQVPIITSETVNQNSDADNPNVNRTVQYRDTGIILNVTPRINYNGIILLDIDQQVSEAQKNETGVNDSPIILSRQLKTKLAVTAGQSILMGGLIEKKISTSESGIPLLKDIPYLGAAFKHSSETTRKTELLIMITPYVIESEDVLDQYTRIFKEKMDRLRGDLLANKQQPKP